MQVEARSSEAVSIPGWFNSIENYVNNNLRTIEIPRGVVDNQGGDSIIRKKNARKKRRRLVKKVTKRFENGMPNVEVYEVEQRKKRKKKKKSRKIFEKAERDLGVDSNLSVSREKSKDSRKPVDIIVHIKMSE
ncbi:unnamed protein product [Diatraea saccharalis]|uniref:Uncharacterized protein n=1 Tax=Diatraea saccharalis TaxID=40085 RepID=A0A9N9RE59_9NEOP|nr:unnamed protein product [Diatraea saccharalis]